MILCVFVRISEQTAIIFVVLEIDMRCVYCEVRSEPLDVIQVNQSLQRVKPCFT